MTAKFNRFTDALRQLCHQHNVTLGSDSYGDVAVYDWIGRPIYAGKVNDFTNETSDEIALNQVFEWARRWVDNETCLPELSHENQTEEERAGLALLKTRRP